MRATCPKCGQPQVTASLAGLRAHIRACEAGKPVKATNRAARPVVAGVYTGPFPVTFQLEREIPSQNIHHNQHWSGYSAEKHVWLSLVALTMKPVLNCRFPWSSWQIIRVMGPKSRLYDHANLVGGAKPLVDSIRDNHIVLDDAPPNILIDYDQEIGDRCYTLITLKETADAPKTVRRVRRPAAGDVRAPAGDPSLKGS